MAQKDLEVAAIGGKDSMSGSFEDIHVPPTLISFAVTTENIDNIISPEFKNPNSKVVLLKPEYDENGLPIADSLKKNFEIVNKLNKQGKILSCYTLGYGGIAEAIMKMCFGNNIGFEFNNSIELKEIFDYYYGAFVIELIGDEKAGKIRGEEEARTNLEKTVYEKEVGVNLGKTISEQKIIYKIPLL